MNGLSEDSRQENLLYMGRICKKSRIFQGYNRQEVSLLSKLEFPTSNAATLSPNSVPPICNVLYPASFILSQRERNFSNLDIIRFSDASVVHIYGIK